MRFERVKYYRNDGTLDYILFDRSDILTTYTVDSNGFLHSFNNKPGRVMYRSDEVIWKEYYYKHGREHRTNDKPAIITYNTYTNKERILTLYVLEECYKVNGKIHRENGKPAILSYFHERKIQCEIYMENNLEHRIEGPSRIEYRIDGTIINKAYWIHGKYFENKRDWEIEANRIKMLNEIS